MPGPRWILDNTPPCQDAPTGRTASDGPADDGDETRGDTVHNRVALLMAHTSRYSFQGRSRLAQDCRVSRSTVTKLLDGRSRPSFVLAVAVTRALERALRRPLDPRDLFSLDGAYPTPNGCALCGCRGGHPYGEDDGLRLAEHRRETGRPERRQIRPPGGGAPGPPGAPPGLTAPGGDGERMEGM